MNEKKCAWVILAGEAHLAENAVETAEAAVLVARNALSDAIVDACPPTVDPAVNAARVALGDARGEAVAMEAIAKLAGREERAAWDTWIDSIGAE